MTVEIVIAPVTEADIAKIESGINAAAQAIGAPPYDAKLFALRAQQGDDTIGYLTGRVFWQWLYIDLLWVEPALQKTGIGTALMQRAETAAREHQLTGIYLWTQDWQAPEFYQKLGYHTFARFDNFPQGHERIGLMKYL